MSLKVPQANFQIYCHILPWVDGLKYMDMYLKITNDFVHLVSGFFLFRVIMEYGMQLPLGSVAIRHKLWSQMSASNAKNKYGHSVNQVEATCMPLIKSLICDYPQ